jgi:ceramide glucosyltransferase
MAPLSDIRRREAPFLSQVIHRDFEWSSSSLGRMASVETVEGFLLAPTATSAGLYLAMVSGFLRGMAKRKNAPLALRETPRVSILKPLAGLDDELAQNLASFAALDYPSFEILLGVASLEDPACAVARSFLREFPQLDARLLVTDPEEAKNPKVAQLLSLEREATGEIVVVSDSNVLVLPNYLQPLLAELCQPGVALVSSLIAGSGEQTFGAALENLQLGALVAPSIVAAAQMTGKVITVGKSMAMWREPLHLVGGFERVANLLGEDHMLGRAFADAGFGVRVSLTPVANRNVACSFKRTVERHTRWAKLRRAIVPFGFAVEPTLSPVLVATVCWLFAPSRITCAAFAAAFVLQLVGAFVTTRVLRGRLPSWQCVPLELIRSYLFFFCWLRACVSKRVRWRGHDFELARDSEIIPAEPSVWTRLRTLVRAA